MIFKTQFYKGTNLEAIYLLGNFGVKLKETKPYITSLPRKLKLGALQQKLLLTVAYGPRNFITEGDSFAEEYILIPQGLMKYPEVNILE